jgi:hypothetical protein
VIRARAAFAEAESAPIAIDLGQTIRDVTITLR